MGTRRGGTDQDGSQLAVAGAVDDDIHEVFAHAKYQGTGGNAIGQAQDV